MGRKGKKIVGYHIGRQNIRVYESAKNAAESLGLAATNITACLKNRYDGILDGWIFWYYDEFFETDLYKKSTPDGARKEGMLLLERFREAREAKGKFCSRERMNLQDYVYNYIKDLISLHEKELVEYDIKMAEIDYNIALLRTKMESMRIEIDYCKHDADTFKRLADILSDPGEANWYKEKYLNLMEICQDIEMKMESTSKEYINLIDYDKEDLHAKYFDKLDVLRKLGDIYDEFVGILEGENL